MARTVTERDDAVRAVAETFRTHGFAGASLSLIVAGTGLGKGSLYHFFPGGKEEMAAAVLEEVNAWFVRRIYDPLREPGDPRERIAAMVEATVEYFESHQRVCLFAAFVLGGEQERFSASIRTYFEEWIDTLADALADAGHSSERARALAIDAVAGIQGMLVLSRALHDPAAFRAGMDRVRTRLAL